MYAVLQSIMGVICKTEQDTSRKSVWCYEWRVRMYRRNGHLGWGDGSIVKGLQHTHEALHIDCQDPCRDWVHACSPDAGNEHRRIMGLAGQSSWDSKIQVRDSVSKSKVEGDWENNPELSPWFCHCSYSVSCVFGFNNKIGKLFYYCRTIIILLTFSCLICKLDFIIGMHMWKDSTYKVVLSKF